MTAVHPAALAAFHAASAVHPAAFAHAFAVTKAAGLPSVRIDTHPGNAPMARALEKAGFVRCGTIILKGGAEDGDLRVAYEKLV